MLHYYKTENVDAEHGTHRALLERIAIAAADAARLAVDRGGAYTPPPDPLHSYGFSADTVEIDFVPVGLLGLRMLVSDLILSKNDFISLMAEQMAKSGGKQWQLGRAANAVTFHMAMYFGILENSSPRLPRPQPFLLNFYKIHLLGTRLFHRLWTESNATAADFERINSLVGSQLRLALRNEKRSYFDVERCA